MNMKKDKAVENLEYFLLWLSIGDKK